MIPDRALRAPSFAVGDRDVNPHLTSSNNTEILEATRRDVAGKESLSLIACTVGFDRLKSNYPNELAPTSLEYRIVLNFEFEEWIDDIALQP